VENKLANPAAIGLAAFGLTTFLLNVVNAGLVPPEAIGMVLPMGLFYGGMAQFAAGMWEVKRGDTFGATAFTSFGAFWIALAVMLLFEGNGLITAVPASGVAWFLIAWGIFSFYMTIGATQVTKLLTIVFATLTLLFFLLAAADFTGSALLKQVAGFEGIAVALFAVYHGAAILLQESFGYPVLPVGHVKPKKSVKSKK
jgi:succinate-acetate transporter protein